MKNKTVFNCRVLLGAIFAILATVSSLASCGGGIQNSPNASGSPTTKNPTIVSVYATPAIIASGSSAVITWSSANSISCSSQQVSISGTSGSFPTGNLTSNTSYTITCVGPADTTSQSVMIPVTNTNTLTLNAIQTESNVWATAPVRGAVHYFCDCGTGANANCVAGNDANAGTSKSAPRQTIGAAIAQYNALVGTGPDTFAFCKGGAFNAISSGSGNNGFFMTNPNCPPGNALATNTCTDFREYDPSPVFTSNSKPIINNPPGNYYLLSFMNAVGGVRFMNLRIQGDVASLALNTQFLFTYGAAHDITIGNVDIDSLALPFNQNGGSPTVHQSTNIVIRGSRITNSSSIGYLGGGPNADISYNYWDSNGSNNIFNHTIYISGGGLDGNITNMKFVGNYIHGQYGSTCYGAVLTLHGTIDTIALSNNVLDIDQASSSGGCYGIAIGSGGYPTPGFFGHVTISNNTLNNTGDMGIGVAACSDCLIESNLVTFNVGNSRPVGVSAAFESARTSPPDNINTRATIINNTIWTGPNEINGILGVQIKNEGNGYIVANNTVNYTTSGVGVWGGIACFDYPLPLASYTFINNNHCNSAAPYVWEFTSASTLSAWQSSSGGFDSASILSNPNFVNTSTSPYDFHPSKIPPISPLLGSGSSAHVPLTDITNTPFLPAPAIGAYE